MVETNAKNFEMLLTLIEIELLMAGFGLDVEIQ